MYGCIEIDRNIGYRIPGQEEVRIIDKIIDRKLGD
jgi:hypothetical protein